MKEELLSDDASLRASAFEAAIIAALDLDPLGIDLDRLGAAYTWLSNQLNSGPAAPSATMRPGSARMSEVDIAAVFGLVYAARTFHAAHRILSAYPPGVGTIVELGAGWGPFALGAVGHRSSSPILADASRPALERARRLFAAAQAPDPTIISTDLVRFVSSDPVGALAVPFVLNELSFRNDPAALRHQVARWAELLSPTGRLYLLEPGTLQAARRLQHLRDDLPANLFIHAPCTGALHCPQLERPTDWCHFTWPTADGPLARALGDRAHRRWQEQHLSFLVLGRRPAESDEGLRVLDTRPHGHAKVVTRTCSREGLVQLTALRRHPAHATLSGLEAGMLVSVTGAEQKGDGLRIEEPESVRVLRAL